MKILVIGNGFDLDHKLPTSYKNFLEFCNYVIEKHQSPGYIDTENRINDKQLMFYKKLENESNLDLFLTYLDKNLLINYFIKKSKGVNWIDFESEIKNIVDVCTELEKEYSNENTNYYEVNSKHKAIDLCSKLKLHVFHQTGPYRFEINAISLQMLYNSLYLYLDKLTKALELYISEFINIEKLNTFSPDIVEFNPDRVISFNYSNTFERLYSATSNAKNVDYIHGKAHNIIGLNTDSNIVLGITSDQTVKSNYVTFEKYYQRITKRTGAQYKEWLKNNDEQIDIMFFGHSLDSADTDILIDLIENKKSFVKILYHDNTSYKTIVENLNRVLGKEKLISYVYGSKPKIAFIKQQKSCEKTSRGWEITHDIARINNLHLLSNTEIETLLEKINDRINKRDINYFYSQKSLISLYDAFSKQRLNNQLSIETASTIAKELNYDTSDGLLVEYHIDFWTTIDQFNVKHFSYSTERLIDEINKTNSTRFHDELKYSLTTLISSLKAKREESEIISIIRKIISNKSFFENKKNMQYLIRICEDNDIIIEILRKLENNNELEIGYIIKVRNIIKEYENNIYFSEMLKAQAREEDWAAQVL